MRSDQLTQKFNMRLTLFSPAFLCLSHSVWLQKSHSHYCFHQFRMTLLILSALLPPFPSTIIMLYLSKFDTSFDMFINVVYLKIRFSTFNSQRFYLYQIHKHDCDLWNSTSHTLCTLGSFLNLTTKFLTKISRRNKRCIL